MSDDVKELAKLIVDWLESRGDKHLADVDFRHELYKFVREL